jgi:ligand-binding sensor domain-containing protein
MSTRYSPFIIVSITLITVTAYSQSKQWQFYYSAYKDLPSSNVKSIAIDIKGISWFGTDNGFASFDGLKWKQFKMRDYNLPDSKISKIVVDKNNCKWMATNNGLIKYNDTTISVFNTTNSKLPANYISSIAIDDSNNVWVATWTTIKGALTKIRGKLMTSIASPYPTMVDLKLDRQGNLWIAAEEYGLIKYDKHIFIQYSFQNLNRSVFVRGLAIDTAGSIWIGEVDYKIGRFQNENLTLFDNIPGSGKTFSTSNWEAIACDNEGNVIINSDSGLVKFNENNYSLLYPKYAHYPIDEINTILSTADGSLWIGSLSTGAFKLKGGIWEHYDASNGIPSNLTLSIAIDKNNVKWIGTLKGLARLQGDNWQVFNVFNSSLPSNIVTHLDFDRSGSLWIATTQGVVKFDGTNWKVYTKTNSGIPDNVFYGLKTEGDKVWLSTSYGLSNFDGKQWINYTSSNSGIPQGGVGPISVDKNGIKWLNIGYIPIVAFDGKIWTQYTPQNSGIGSTIISGISVDNQNRKWFGTGNGLVCYDNSSWRLYNKNNTGFNLIDVIKIANDQNDKLIAGGWFDGLYIYGGAGWKYYDTVRTETNAGISAQDIVVDKYNNKWITESTFGLVVFNENGVIASVEPSANTIIKSYILLQNYPNPFNPSTTIKYSIPVDPASAGRPTVSLKVYDLLGREIATLVNGEKSPGNYEVNFDGTGLTSGIYFYTIRAGNFVLSKKMLLLK